MCAITHYVYNPSSRIRMSWPLHPARSKVRFFFFWLLAGVFRKNMGDYSFDPQFWPDVPAMMANLTTLGMRVMVSAWPFQAVGSSSIDQVRENSILFFVIGAVNTRFTLHARARGYFDSVITYGCLLILTPTNAPSRSTITAGRSPSREPTSHRGGTTITVKSSAIYTTQPRSRRATSSGPSFGMGTTSTASRFSGSTPPSPRSRPMTPPLHRVSSTIRKAPDSRLFMIV